MNSYKYKLSNLDCANCALKIENRLKKEPYLNDVKVNFSLMKLTFKSEKNIDSNKLLKIIKSVEPEVEFDNNNDSNKSRIIKLLIGLTISIIGIVLKIDIILLIGYILLLYQTLINSIKSLIKSREINENLLVTISCIGAYLIGTKNEGFIVIFLYELGKILESIAINKSRKSINNLISNDIEYSNILVKNEEIKIETTNVKVGDILIVKKGEKIPLDGIIIEGTSNINTSIITGESGLLALTKNDKVISGYINMDSPIKIKVTSNYDNSTIKRIIDLTESASDRKSKRELIINKLIKKYTITVILLSIIAFLLLPITFNITYKESIYRALSLLVISCPCSIVISIPLSYFSCIGISSKNGILIKGSNYIDIINYLDEIAFDKTGTITTGKFIINDLILLNNKYKKEYLIKILVSGEALSNHPLAKSIVNHFNMKDKFKISNYKEIEGMGITFNIDNKNIIIGNKKLCKTNIDINSNILIKINNEIVAYLLLEDEIKNRIENTIKELNNKKIKTILLTGDNKIKTELITQKINFSDYKYELLPEDKYNYIKQELDNNKIIAYIGDGINDAPSLALSSVGISLGKIGTDIAIESSDIIFLNDDISKIITLMNIAKKTNIIIKENLIFAILVKIATIILCFLGLTSMWQAIFADVGVTLICIFNTLRITKEKY